MWLPFRRRYIQKYFRELKFVTVNKISRKFASKVPIEKKNILGLNDGVTSIRQASIWTNADPIDWRIYATFR